MAENGGADDRLVWIDLEMTGLDVERHDIVELAVLVTDAAHRGRGFGAHHARHRETHDHERGNGSEHERGPGERPYRGHQPGVCGDDGRRRDLHGPRIG